MGKKTSGEPSDRQYQAAPKAGRKSALIGGLIFFSLGAGALYGLGIRSAWKVHCAESWPRVPCKIISSEVGRHSGSKGGSTYSVDIEYEYVYQKKTYRGDDYDFTGGSSSGYDAKRAAVDAFLAGTTRECHVNPDQPDEAVLSTELGWPAWVFGFGLGGVFTAIGGLCLYGAAFGNYDKSGRTTNEVVAADGRIRLKPEHGPVTTFVALLIFSLIWNGFTALPIAEVVKSLVSGKNLQGGLFLFIAIFGTIGGFMLYQTGKACRALFSPRVIIEIDRCPAVGGNLAIQWRIQGDALKLRSLTLALEAYREYSTGTGKSRKTHKEILHTLPVHRTEGRVMESGNATVAIPGELPPSDDFIRWRVTVRADVSGGVDVSTDHLLTVLPAANPFAQ